MRLAPANAPNRRLAERVRRLGFRKWYERELLSSHAHMVLALLSLIAMLASFEALRGAPATEQLMNLLFVAVSAAVGLWALRRYLFLLMRAELVASQASCEQCGAYGRFDVVAESRDETQVCCRRCAHRWIIRDGSPAG